MANLSQPGTGHQLTETVAAIIAAHRAGTMTPAQTVARSYQRIRDHNDPAMFISLRDEGAALAEAEALAAEGRRDCRSMACRWRSRTTSMGRPADHRRLPGLLLHARAAIHGGGKTARAGAIIIGKTNLDQFATGLVGVRSPYGVPRNPIAPQSHPRRLEFGLGGRGIGRARAARARHRYRGIRPRAGGAQQHRRPQAEPRADLQRRAGAGLPLARLRLGVLARPATTPDRARRNGGP